MKERAGAVCSARSRALPAIVAAVLGALTLLSPTVGEGNDGGGPARGSRAVRERPDRWREVVRDGRGTVRAIVVLNDGVADPAGASAELARACGGKRRHVYARAISGFALELPARELARLEADPRVRYVDVDRVLASAGASGAAPPLPAGLSRIDGELNATAAIDGGGDGVDVDIAVLDSGVSSTHPDLNVHRSVSFVVGTSPEDLFGHGTHVAGIAAARDDSSGVVGVAPGARIWSVKVLNDYGFGLASDIIAGIDWVTARAGEIDVANMSLGGTGLVDDGDCGRTNGDAMHEAICNSVDAGVVYVVAAGNNAGNAATKIPASYDEVITVSAVVETDGLPGGLGEPTVRGPDDTLANFSNFGADVDLAAPGVDVRSTWPGGGTEIRSGTSMSAPHVTGAAALWIARHGKPADAEGTVALRDALVNVGYQQPGPDGFGRDQDEAAEPLLSSRGVDPVTAESSRLHVEVFAGERFNTFYETSTPLRVLVRAAAFDRVRGLGSSGFEVRVDGAPVLGAFVEVQPGIYQGTASLLGLDVGEHIVEVVARDRNGATGTARRPFVTESFAPAPAVQARLATDRLAYSAYFGVAGVELTVELSDELGRPITGLGAASFATTLFGGTATPGYVFEETATPGVYRTGLLITELADGAHRVRVTVSDARGLSGEATARYRSADSIVLGEAQVELQSERPVYDAFHGQDRARVTMSIRGPQQQPFSGIGPTQLELLVDGVSRDGNFAEAAVAGDYEVSVDLRGLPNGMHRLVAIYRIGPQQAYFAQVDVYRRVLELSW